MGLVWNPVGLPGTLAMVVGCAMAFFVYFAAPHRLQNRFLALVLFFEGTTWGAGSGLLYFMGDVDQAYGVQAIFYLSFLVLPPLYLLFLSTLDTPLARPFRPRAVRMVLGTVATLLPAVYFSNRAAFTVAMVSPWYARWDAVLGPGFTVAFLTLGVASLFGLACAITTFLRAPRGTMARKQAKIFTVAFGIRDGLLAVTTLIFPLVMPLPPSGRWTDLMFLWGGPTITLLFVPIMTYGILKYHLFDIDIRIRWTIRQGTLATIFVGVFIVAAQLGQNLLGDLFGWAAGGVAAGLMLFALHPLQRFAENVARKALPKAEPTDAYLAFKKMEIYQAALESAWRDGRITRREQSTLERLRDKLEIDAHAASRLEGDVRRMLRAA